MLCLNPNAVQLIGLYQFVQPLEHYFRLFVLAYHYRSLVITLATLWNFSFIFSCALLEVSFLQHKCLLFSFIFLIAALGFRICFLLSLTLREACHLEGPPLSQRQNLFFHFHIFPYLFSTIPKSPFFNLLTFSTKVCSPIS